MANPNPTPGLVLDYTVRDGAACLVRVYSGDPCPILPETVDGLPLTALGAYCFAPEQPARALPPADALHRCTLPGGDPCDNRVGGNFLQEITLPRGLACIGSCAFYNCRKLAKLSLGAQVRTVGSDVFLNTFALTQITVQARPDGPCGLFEVLNSIVTDVRVLFRPEDTVLAAATYPEYWMDAEESPAHIFLQTYAGQGYRYRQCFQGQVPEWGSYDAVLPQSSASNPARIMTQLALDRLRWPFALTDAARDAYRAYLKQQLPTCMKNLLRQQDTEALQALLALDLMDVTDLQAAAQQARQADNAAFAALLANALAARQPKQTAQTKANRYDFDF